MCLKNTFTFLKNWRSLILVFIPFIILYFVNLSSNKVASFEEFKKGIELTIWLFNFVMALVTFSTLFVAFTYENKLVVASRNQKAILKPYNLSKNEIRTAIISYNNSLKKDKILHYVFWLFMGIIFFAMLIWGTMVAVYTNFKFSFVIDLNISSLIIFGIYAVYIILFLILFSILIAIKLILLNKDPFDKGYLPNGTKICDVNYFLENGGDLDEFLVKNSLTLDFFKNHLNKKNFSYDVSLILPIQISKLKFILKLYDENDDLLVTFFGKTKNLLKTEEIAGSYYKEVAANFDKDICSALEKQDSCYGICKVVDDNFKVISRLYLKKKTIDTNNFIFVISKKLFNETTIDHDGKLLNKEKLKVESDFVHYQIETRSVL